MCNFCRYVGLDSFFYFFCPTFVSISFYALFSIFASSYVTRGFLILNMTFLCHNFPQNNCSHIFLAPLHILELSPTSCIVMVSQLFLYSVYMKELLFLFLFFHNFIAFSQFVLRISIFIQFFFRSCPYFLLSHATGW